jgi:hypothetical protein
LGMDEPEGVIAGEASEAEAEQPDPAKAKSARLRERILQNIRTRIKENRDNPELDETERLMTERMCATPA